MGDNDRGSSRRRAEALPVVWRARDVADLYGVDESTVRRWERAGALRPARLDPGGNKYWLRDEILADTRAEPDAPALPRPVTGPLDVLVAKTRRPRRRREPPR